MYLFKIPTGALIIYKQALAIVGSIACTNSENKFSVALINKHVSYKLIIDKEIFVENEFIICCFFVGIIKILTGV